MLNKFYLSRSVLYSVYSSAIICLAALFITGNVFVAISICLIVLLVLLFTFKGFDKLVNKALGSDIKPGVIWLTGLSGSGKTTIALSLVKQLKKRSFNPVLLDGDEIRNVFNQHGYDEDSRKKHNLNIGHISSLLEKQGNIVIVSLISPYIEVRDVVRNICTNFIEVHVATSLDICVKRDPKGLYKRALLGEIKDFTGISAPYYPPANPEVTVDTAKMTADDCSRSILSFLNK